MAYLVIIRMPDLGITSGKLQLIEDGFTGPPLRLSSLGGNHLVHCEEMLPH